MKPTIEVTISPKLLGYLRALADIEGFGDNAEQVAERLIWAGVNRLIEVGRLTPGRILFEANGTRAKSSEDKTL